MCNARPYQVEPGPVEDKIRAYCRESNRYLPSMNTAPVSEIHYRDPAPKGGSLLRIEMKSANEGKTQEARSS